MELRKKGSPIGDPFFSQNHLCEMELKRMKKLASYFLTICLLSSTFFSTSVQAANIQVKINGEVANFDQPPIIYHDFTLVPLRGIFEVLGAEVKWDDKTRKITAIKDDVEVSIVVGSSTGFVNSIPVPLDVEARIVEGRTMVPLRFISESFGAEVKWDHQTRTVFITTAKKDEASNENLNNNLDAEKRSSTSGMSYEEAVALAINQSPELRSVQIDIKKADLSLESASDAIDFIPARGGNQQATAAYSNWTRAQTAYFMAQRQYEMAKEKIEFNVKSAYYDVLVKQEELKLARMILENSELKKRIADIKASNGIASAFEATQAKLAVDEAKASLQSLEKELEGAYANLNKLIGKNANERYSLSSQPVFEKLDIDLETTVAQVASGSSAVWLAEQQVNLADLDVRYFTFTGTTNDRYAYDQTQLNFDQARVAAADTKQQIAAAARSIFYNITQLEQQYEVLQANLAKAQEALRLTQVRYDQGMATAEEVFEARLAVEQLQLQIRNLIAQHDTLKMALKKPWVATAT